MKKKLTEQAAKELDEKVEELDLHDLSEKDISRVVSGISQEGMTLRRQRKNVRYQLYRLKAESFGSTFNVSEKEFIERFENDPAFEGWKKFAETWDVSLDDPYRIVSRKISQADEWDALVRAKFPQVAIGGGITYPDVKVKEKVDAEIIVQNKKKKAKKKAKGNK